MFPCSTLNWSLYIALGLSPSDLFLLWPRSSSCFRPALLLLSLFVYFYGTRGGCAPSPIRPWTCKNDITASLFSSWALIQPAIIWWGQLPHASSTRLRKGHKDSCWDRCAADLGRELTRETEINGVCELSKCQCSVSVFGLWWFPLTCLPFTCAPHLFFLSLLLAYWCSLSIDKGLHSKGRWTWEAE